MLQLPSRTPSLRSLSSDRVAARPRRARRSWPPASCRAPARRRETAAAGDVDVAALDQLREVAEEQRQQQHLDVRAVDVGVGQDADLAVAQAREVGRRRRRRADRRRSPTAMSWISLLANRRSRSTSQVFSTLPRSGRIAWYSLSRPILARAAGRVALDQEQLVAREVAGSRSRSACPAARRRREPLRFSTFWPARWRVCAWRIDELGDLLAVLDVLVQPQLERRPHAARDQRAPPRASSAAPWSGPGTAGRAPCAESTKRRARTRPRASA